MEIYEINLQFHLKYLGQTYELYNLDGISSEYMYFNSSISR
jgi:hypothetical protein